MRHWLLPALVLLAFSFACTDEEEALVDSGVTASPSTTSAALEPTPTPSVSQTVPPVSVLATAVPTAPPDWATYTLSEAALTLRYPQGWYALKDGGIYSWDPQTWDKPWYPPESMAVSVIYGSSEFAEPRPAKATDFSNAVGSGWEITYSKNAATDDGLTLVHEVALQRGAFTLFIIASFSQSTPDEDTFSKIVNSVRLAK